MDIRRTKDVTVVDTDTITVEELVLYSTVLFGTGCLQRLRLWTYGHRMASVLRMACASWCLYTADILQGTSILALTHAQHVALVDSVLLIPCTVTEMRC